MCSEFGPSLGEVSAMSDGKKANFSLDLLKMFGTNRKILPKICALMVINPMVQRTKSPNKQIQVRQYPGSKWEN